MTLVVDASMVTAALVSRGPDGRWAEALLLEEQLAAPHLLLAEVANILRRAARAEHLSADHAALAHRDLLQLRVELFPYAPFAERVWELPDNVTAYDAWYVAVAELLQAPLATFDERLIAATGPRCEFSTPPS